MKAFFYLLPLLILAACTGKSKRPAPDPEQVSHLLSLYKNISFDTLKVFTEYDVEIRTYKGTPMDSTATSLLPKPYNTKHGEFFACNKFSLDNNRLGLITRVPSTYDASSVMLFIFDTEKQSFTTDYFELSEAVGDAGASLIKTSWLMKDGDHTSAFIHVEEHYDHSAEDEKDSIQESWDHYYLLNIGKKKIDTVSKDNEYLKTKFGHLFLPRKF